MNPELFLADLERAPETLGRLARGECEGASWEETPAVAASSLVLLGMGSSHYANQVAAARLRARGVDAVAELASSDLLPLADAPGSVVVAVSAGGSSQETLAAVDRYRGRVPVVALTNRAASPLVDACDATVLMGAEAEAGGVACRSYQHTVGLLLRLEEALVGEGEVSSVLDRAAAACADLLSRRGSWLPDVREVALGPQGTHVVAPARRLGSALQGALMLREGPRLPAYACESGDWSHVDVYLTKTTDYRMLLFTGSRWEPELLRWLTERGSRLVGVGDRLPEAEVTVEYAHSDDDDVRLLAEVLVPSLLAAEVWAEQSAPR